MVTRTFDFNWMVAAIQVLFYAPGLSTGLNPVRSVLVGNAPHIFAFAVFFFFLFSGNCIGQTGPDSTMYDLAPESLLEVVEDENAALQTLDALSYLNTHPLDLNTASTAELSQVPLLGPLLAHNIVSYRDQHGHFSSIQSLQIVPGITEEIYYSSLPYLTVTAIKSSDSGVDTTPENAKPVVKKPTINFVQRVSHSTRQPEVPGKIPFSSEHVLTRLSLVHESGILANLTLEKDAGENFRWHPSSQTFIYDFISGYVAYKGRRHLNLVIGDYTVNAGSGLILWQRGGFSAGREPVRQIPRYGSGISPYASTDENRFFHGLAASKTFRERLHLSIFGSRHAIDASIQYSDSTAFESGNGFISSFPSTGLHRSKSELLNKDAAHEIAFGTLLSYTQTRISLGLTAYHTRYELPVLAGDQPYRLFDFSGRKLSSVAAYGNLQFHDVLLFTEIGNSSKGSPGGLIGAQVRQGNTAELVLHARYYPRDFYSLHGSAYAQQSGPPQNEKGVYLGIRLTPGPGWKLAAYIDEYTFPWLKFGIYKPSRGYESLFSITYSPRNWLTLYVQAKSERNEDSILETDATGRMWHETLPVLRQSFRVHGEYVFSRQLRLRSRFEISRFSSQIRPVENGFLSYQEIRWLPFRKMSIDARYLTFDIDSYNARIYAYENSVRHTSSLPVFTGKGDRFYVLLSFEFRPGISIQTKWAQHRIQNPVHTHSSASGTSINSIVNEFTTQLWVRI